MNLRPGSLPRFLVCHSLSCGFLDFWPTTGFFTTASLKWSTTAAMAKTPPSHSYRLFSRPVCLACAIAVFAQANTVTGAAFSASPAMMLRLVIEVDPVRPHVTSCSARPDDVRLGLFAAFRGVAFSCQASPGLRHVQEVSAALWRQLPIGRKVPALGLFCQAVVGIEALASFGHDSS